MSKRAEEKAFEAYPPVIGIYSDSCLEYDANESDRLTYQEGYEQAEKDLEWEVNHREEAYMNGVKDGLKERLTWEDAQLLHIITEKYMRELDNRIEAYPSSSQELFEEVLRRFYEKKK